MFQLWQTRPSFKRLFAVGKWGPYTGQQASPLVSPARNSNDNTITGAVVKCTATVVKGRFGGVAVELMLDSCSSISLVQCDVLKGTHNVASPSDESKTNPVSDSIRRLTTCSTACQGFSSVR